ncbi:dehydrosqualene desaturase [Vallitalea longa]|uniref:Dehydrosqualene desaturase n=1 Tax=Vallitalea longa TaxID=2936439 RepID=A0A9W5YA21_9FIRM|nr:phytoene desaturase family protein [Vallitalea longa]GKX29667.1 dehydrosqualene desaturase [Vallitalea longa]
MKTAIIVGAGIGGLATAAKLSSKGYKVTIYEKDSKIGGKVNYIDAGNFKFDLTASILMTPHIYQEVFDYAGKDYKNYLKFIELNPIYRAFYSDGTSFDLFSNTSNLTKKLEEISKEDSMGYYKFLSNVYEKYIIAEKFFLNNSFTSSLDFFNFISLQKMLKINTLSSSYNHISKYITSEKLRNLIAFQSLYVGISPFDGPNIYNLIPTISQLYGLWYLEGGMYSYVNALERLIYELGGKIIKNTAVSEIIIEKGTAIGVKSVSGIDRADIIICDADFPYAVKNLIKAERAKGKYTDKKISEMKYTCSTFIMHLGLKKTYPKLLVHNIYIGNDFKENIQSAFIGKLPKHPSLYIYCPSRIDNTMAENGTESINIMVRVPNTLNNNIIWNDSTINLMRERIFNDLSNMEILSDIQENIIYENITTPQDFLERFNSYGGTAFGLSPTLLQTNYFRPHIKSPTVNNLYFVGNSVHPGTGVSIVLLSSKLAVEEILNQ